MDDPRSGTATYVSLRSFKRDGGAVDTPVWAAPLDGTLVVFTLRESFKVKRIRRNPRVQVAPCGVFGAVTGDWVDGTCRLVEDAAHEARAYAALDAKYGWQMRLGTWMRRLTGGLERRVILEIAFDRVRR
jgi:PPOX class probable F420-dependent enzyme